MPYPAPDCHIAIAGGFAGTILGSAFLTRHNDRLLQPHYHAHLIALYPLADRAVEMDSP